MICPIFKDGNLIAFAGSTAHTVDIGGAPSPTAQDSFEEGLCIPICKIMEAGAENPVVIDFLTENLREPALIMIARKRLFRFFRRNTWIISKL